MKSRVDTLVLAVCGLALATALAAVRAQSLADPTRPPAVLGNSGAAGDNPESSGLQTIIRRNFGKPAAIINGEYVVLGGRVGDARLVKIGEDSVTLKTATGRRETLMLIPGVEKKPIMNNGTKAAKKGRNSDEEERK